MLNDETSSRNTLVNVYFTSKICKINATMVSGHFHETVQVGTYVELDSSISLICFLFSLRFLHSQTPTSTAVINWGVLKNNNRDRGSRTD